MKPRLLIGHNHRLFVEGLEQLLAMEFDIVGTSESLTSLPEAVRSLRPDVVVQGLSTAPQVGLEVISRIHDLSPTTRIAVVTMWADATLAVDALRHGASAYIPQTSSAAELLAGVRAAMSDGPYVPPELAGDVIAFLLTSSLEGPRKLVLTHRQREVLQLLAQGLSMKEVAAALQMTPRTVAFHKYKVMERLGIKSSAELVQFAVKRGFV